MARPENLTLGLWRRFYFSELHWEDFWSLTKIPYATLQFFCFNSLKKELMRLTFPGKAEVVGTLIGQTYGSVVLVNEGQPDLCDGLKARKIIPLKRVRNYHGNWSNG